MLNFKIFRVYRKHENLNIFIQISKFTLNTYKLEGMRRKMTLYGRTVKLRERYYIFVFGESILMVHYLGIFQRGVNS